MPELPEVETVRQGLAPHLENKPIQKVVVRRRDLRWAIPSDLEERLSNQKIIKIDRRGKYLLFNLANDKGQLIIHLGMSGTLRLYTENEIPQKHDHIEFHIPPFILRFNDPRRFGAVLWTKNNNQHPLIMHLGPEPHDHQTFHQNYLYKRSRKK